MALKVVEFFDGFTSETQPNLTEIVAEKLQTYVDDAAFVTNKGSAAAEGDIYGNTTLNVIRYYDGTSWVSIASTTYVDDAIDTDVATHAALTATHGATGAVVGTTNTQTLTNKTLTTPVISQISNTGTLTLPTSTDTLVGKATTDTLTNKTLTSPVLNTGVSGTAVKDEDDMVSDSATHLCTQQSIKKYVDDNAGGVPAGMVADFGNASLPSGWLFCNGQAVSRATYSTLFTAISTRFGVGDGSTTFNVPFKINQKRYDITFSSSPTGWSTQYAYMTPFEDDNGDWYGYIAVSGTWTNASNGAFTITNATLGHSATTDFWACYAVDRNAINNPVTQAEVRQSLNDIRIYFTNATTTPVFAGVVPLSGKPTFVDDNATADYSIYKCIKT